MKYVIIISRYILSIPFIILGLNLIHPFLPMPPMPADSIPTKFMMIMGPSHWMALVGIFQIVGGVLVVIGGTAPMGLVFLGPILVNILSFHILMNGGHGVGPVLILSVIEVFLIYSYRNYFLPIFTLNAKPK